MSAFDLTKFNNINLLLCFKLFNQPTFVYQEDKNLFYTSVCLDRYNQDSEKPRLYGPDEVVITYTYWHNKQCNEQDESPIVVLGHEFDKDVRESWFDAASYHKYDDINDEYDYDDSDDER